MQDLTLLSLEKMLDTATLRHKAIANNLANANTPGYRRRIVSFDDHLAKAIAARDPGALRSWRPKVTTSSEAALSPDGNNVSLERELADLMKNSLVYSTCAQLLSARLAAYKAAISGDSRSA